jgi:hypothetical protein
MSVILRIDGDDTPLKAKIAGLIGDSTKAQAQVDKVSMTLHQVFSYAMHITNLIVSNLSKVAQTKEQEEALQELSMGVQIAQTEVAITYTITRAAAFMAEGTPWSIAKGLSMLGIASMMQGQMMSMLVLKAEQRKLAERLKAARIFYEAYK